jgi:hypothetical protein
LVNLLGNIIVVSERKSSQPVRIANGRIQQKVKDRKAGEPETIPEMEERQETGDDNDKGTDWAKIVQEMQRSIERTQFDMQHHLQETQEHLSRG